MGYWLWVVVIGHWLSVMGYWLLVMGHWLLVIGYGLLVIRDHWLLVIGYSLLVIVYWSLVIGYWSLVMGHWLLGSQDMSGFNFKTTLPTPPPPSLFLLLALFRVLFPAFKTMCLEPPHSLPLTTEVKIKQQKNGHLYILIRSGGPAIKFLTSSSRRHVIAFTVAVKNARTVSSANMSYNHSSCMSSITEHAAVCCGYSTCMH